MALGGVAFLCLFCGALLGMFCGATLPRHHLDAESKDTIRMVMTLLATLSALVVGLLINSAKSSFDDKDGEVKKIAADIVQLDQVMAEYGPETQQARVLFRAAVQARIHQVWSGQTTRLDMAAVERDADDEPLQRQILALVPSNDTQSLLKSSALDISTDIAKSGSILVADTRGTIQWPFLAIQLLGLSILFVSFGLFAPRNATVIAVLFVGALTLSGSIYLIVAMDQPYSGLIRISSEPLDSALARIGQ
ncbi:MAG: DUF4239 domain-containing protein [Xanthobacteraceae bacterium]